MTEFLRRVEDCVRSLGMCGQRVLIAVSGGADSVALLRGMVALRSELGLTLAAAHLDHGLRGEASRADAVWVEEFCRGLDVPIVIEHAVTAALARPGDGLEEAARRVRYEFLKRAARQTGCTHVATAHTADDQAETVLHHILRGTGLAGLRGIPAEREFNDGLRLMRPLLKISRGEIEAWLVEIGQEYRRDATNLDPAYTRNRLRHELLPLLRREFNPRVDAALRRLGEQAADVQGAVECLAERLLGSALQDAAADVCRLDVAALASQPRALVRECFVQLWKRQGWPRQGMGFEEWERLAGMVLGHCAAPSNQNQGADAPRSPGTMVLPGRVEVSRRGNLLILRRPCGL